MRRRREKEKKFCKLRKRIIRIDKNHEILENMVHKLVVGHPPVNACPRFVEEERRGAGSFRIWLLWIPQYCKKYGGLSQGVVNLQHGPMGYAILQKSGLPQPLAIIK